METSAKNATNVEQAFMTMAAEIKNRMQTVPTTPVIGGGGRGGVEIGKTNPQKSGGCCWTTNKNKQKMIIIIL